MQTKDEFGLTPEDYTKIERDFANFDLDAAEHYVTGVDELPPRVKLQRASAAAAYHRMQADKAMRDAVDEVRASGLSWHKIGIMLGVTGEAARQRYGH